MSTLITGASGVVGSAVLRQLIAAGHTVRALVRPNSDHRNLIGLSVEIVTRDLTDRRSLDRALAGCSFLFHVAAIYKLWVPHPEEIYETNVTGTHNIMLAAANAVYNEKKFGIKIFSSTSQTIYCSFTQSTHSAKTRSVHRARAWSASLVQCSCSRLTAAFG